MERRSWAREAIKRLDVQHDYHRIAQLSFVVRYGTPVFLHALFSVAFVHNVGLSDMARILHRGGRGPILRETHKRNFDSLTFFGELYKYGEGPQTLQIIDRLNRIHAAFPIDNDMQRYTLATLSCLPQRISERFAGSMGLSDKECEAQFRFWRRLGELMHISDIPSTRAEFMAWMLDFERSRFTASKEGQEIAAAMAREWAEYWLPRPLQRFGTGLFYALVEPEVRRKMALPEPTALQNRVARGVVRTFFWMKQILPDPRERHMSDYFGREYGASPDIERVGYKPDAP